MQSNRFNRHDRKTMQDFSRKTTGFAIACRHSQTKPCGLKGIALGLLGLSLLPGVCLAEGKIELKSEADKINYSVGYQVGGDFRSQGVGLSSDALLQGIRDALNKSKPQLPREQMNTTLIDLKKKIVAEQQRLEKQAAADNRKASAAFLKENAAQKDVTVLPSGVQYKVLKAGSGKKPTLRDNITIKYRVTRIDGKEIASTDADTPKSYPVAKALPGLREVLPLMGEGAKWRIVLPAATAAGDRDPMNELGVIIYEMELVAVQTAK